MSPCDRDVEQEALTIATHIRQLTSASVSGYAALLKNLRDVEGAKSMIILSQGLMLEGSRARPRHWRRWRQRRASASTCSCSRRWQGNASQARMSETLSQDRDLREAGLEALASRSRGSLFRVVTNPQYIFDRLRNEISAHYMLGVEPAERDRDGRPHQIRVQVGRQNVQVRARRQVQYAVLKANTWSRDVVMARVLRSPAANTRAADAAVDLHVPRCRAEQGEADSRGGDRSRVDGKGARSGHRLRASSMKWARPC